MVADADANVLGPTDVTTAVAANLNFNPLGGIFGCPSCHDAQPSIVEALKLFLPYFPLHIQRFISMYLKMIDFMHTFEMVQNMINHMDEYQAFFKLFEESADSSFTANPEQGADIFSAMFGNHMPDISSIKKMMEGSDFVDEFTYMEEPPVT